MLARIVILVVRSLKKKKNKNAIHLVLAGLCTSIHMHKQMDFSDVVVNINRKVGLGEKHGSADKVEILSVAANFALGPANNFGACIDFGAQLTVIEKCKQNSIVSS